MSISKVLIAGVGTMGQQIGWQCALHGFDVVMFNLRQPSLDTCRKAQREFADLFHREKGQSSDAVAAGDVFEIDGRRIPVIGRDALLRNKRATDRPQDRADIDALERRGAL